MADRLRAGVIGAGVFGGHHARKWANAEDARLTAIFDSHPERAQLLADRVGGQAYADMAAFLDAVDVVSVTTPATSHGAVTLRALQSGKHVYVEKPLAVTPGEADAIVAEAARRKLQVACGFSERVAIEASRLLESIEEPRLIEATRHGAPSPRNQDVSVVLDLMIHDIDLALCLVFGEPLTVECDGVAGESGLLDSAVAEVTMTSGPIAILNASRVADRPQRSVILTYESGKVEIDFLKGTMNNLSRLDLDQDFAAASVMLDPLGYSLERFAQAVGGRGPLVADARDGARALDLALAVEQAAGG